MKTNLIPRMILIAATCGTLAACGANHRPIQLTNYMDDTSVNTNVRSALAGVPGVYDDTATISTTEGVVKLEATVEDKLAAQNAVQAARQVAGVRRVDYTLQLRAP